jgi:serine/threonine-protein phosphatase 2A regulatory subunit A
MVIDGEEALRQIEHLRSDDVSLRISAARKLTTISAALGPDRTREELLPFLSDGVDDEDEVLEAIAGSLGELIRYVGSTPKKNYGSFLLGPLELLLAVEENAVREKAAESAIKVANSLGDDDYRVHFVGMIGRLVNKEWFTARIAGCGLIPVAFGRMGADLQVSRDRFR